MSETSSAQRIYWVGGSKGGVGKSMMTMATLDYLIERGDRVALIETDTSNHDVWNAYHEQVPSGLFDLDHADGWIDFVNTCATQRERTVVVNTAARNNIAVRQHAETLNRSLDELGAKLLTLWVINRQRDGLELLEEFIEAVPKADVHVVRNGHFGDEHMFELYNQSKIKAAIEKRGGRSLTLPDLADRVADDLYSQRIAINAAAKSLPIGNRAELGRWRSQVGRVLAEVMA
jgi:MinD-like ATPase involved in chromosome partitioning or flagellar assembly